MKDIIKLLEEKRYSEAYLLNKLLKENNSPPTKRTLYIRKKLKNVESLIKKYNNES